MAHLAPVKHQTLCHVTTLSPLTEKFAARIGSCDNVEVTITVLFVNLF